MATRATGSPTGKTGVALSNVASTLPLPLTGGLADALGFRRVLALLALVVLSVRAVGVHHMRE